jgi:hypothetical protein
MVNHNGGIKTGQQMADEQVPALRTFNSLSLNLKKEHKMATKKKELSKTKINVMPKKIFAHASPKSVGGVSIFNAMTSINSSTILSFQSEPRTIENAVNQLHEAGFEVLQVTNFTINFAGSREKFEQAFKTKLIIKQRPVIKPGAVKAVAEFI